MRPLWIYGWLLCLLAMQLPCAAQSSLKWSFQRTGYRTTSGTPSQTAISMRSGEAWPVVYSFYENSLNAYSLFPVLNAKGKNHIFPETNWHQIGSNLNGSQFASSGTYLQADSGSPDSFAVSMQTNGRESLPQDSVAIGNSLSGFQSPMLGVQAVKFDAMGNPFTASSSLLPNLPSNVKLYDVAISTFGDVGAVSQTNATSTGTSAITYWQRSPLLGNTWLSTNINIDSRSELELLGPSVDLNFDAGGRPHIVGVNKGGAKVMAYRFDTITGMWTSSVLDSTSLNTLTIADVAAATNDDGVVGAAWVNNGVLKYAFLDTSEISPSWVVTNVATTTPTGVQLELSQGVGLAFDHAGLPVISFVDRTTRQIWVAYDPPSAFGGAITDQPGTEGDFNGDGIVDSYDLDAWGTAFGEDGLDGNDFLAWQRNAIPSAPAATAAVPEPLTLVSGLVGAALLLTSTRTNRREGSKKLDERRLSALTT